MNAAADQMGSEKTAIRPFKVSFPDSELADMRKRINATKWPEREPVTDESQGVPLEGLSRDDVLDNLTLTWLTNTAVSSSRLYRENKLPFFVPMGVKIPVAVSAFPDEIFQCPRSWAEQAYPKLIRFNKLDKGGHFAAWEQSALIAADLRIGFRSLR